MTSIIKMYLTLIGDNFDPTYITKRLGMNPDEVRVKDEILGNGRKFGHYEWGICSSESEADSLQEVINEILERISDKIPHLASIAKEVNAGWEILFTIDIYHDFPAVIFPKSFIRAVAELDAEIGFDVLLLN